MEKTVIELTKEYVAESSLRIKLYDFVAEKTRELVSKINPDQLPIDGAWNLGEFSDRLDTYETVTSDLIKIFAIFGYWATDDHNKSVTLPIKNILSQISDQSGVVAWLALQWFPIYLFTYSMGISSIASSNYGNLLKLFHSMAISPRTKDELPLLIVLVSEILNSDKYFKQLPDRESQFVPRSEYLFEFFKPILNEILYIDFEYERLFDRFELILALEHAHLSGKYGHGIWGPIGRFGWKRNHYNGPIAVLRKEVELNGESWPPLIGGFFDGSIDRFIEVEQAVSERIIRLGWR